jgi:hypothetical protein
LYILIFTFLDRRREEKRSGLNGRSITVYCLSKMNSFCQTSGTAVVLLFLEVHDIIMAAVIRGFD